MSSQRFGVGDWAYFPNMGQVLKVGILARVSDNEYVCYKVTGWQSPIFDSQLCKTRKQAEKIAASYGKQEVQN